LVHHPPTIGVAENRPASHPKTCSPFCPSDGSRFNQNPKFESLKVLKHSF
jgi:hypothetical protein